MARAKCKVVARCFEKKKKKKNWQRMALKTSSFRAGRLQL